MRAAPARAAATFEVFRTPPSIGEPVLRLLRHMGSTRDPVYLRVTPDPDGAPHACYSNVEAKIAREGGRMQFGWAVWLWPRVLIEAEHHAVFDPGDGGPWRDITPGRSAAVKRRLFLPDDGAGANSSRRDNVRLALSDDALIDQFLAAADERGRIWLSDTSGSPSAQALELDRLELAAHLQADAQVRLAMRYTAPDEPCFCGRRRRFGACHGRPQR